MKIFFCFVVIAIASSQKSFIQEKIDMLRTLYYQWTQNYQHTQAQQFFHYTKIAVCHPEEIASWDCGYYCQQHPDMVDIQAFTGNYSSQSYCGFNQKENMIVLVYRSTQDITNWINNVKFFKTEFGDCENCYVHLGFWETYTAISYFIFQ